MPDDRLDLRISSDLKDCLKAAAAADGRSLSNFCIRVLEQALSDSPTGGETCEQTKQEIVAFLREQAEVESLMMSSDGLEDAADRIENWFDEQPYTPPRPKGSKR